MGLLEFNEILIRFIKISETNSTQLICSALFIASKIFLLEFKNETIIFLSSELV